MVLAVGARLGPYEIVSALGAGGMGEVYRARDTRLDRIVAIKVILGRETASPAMRERFEREARAIALLSHPNICTLHDIGHHEGTDVPGHGVPRRGDAGRTPLPSESALVAAAASRARHRRRGAPTAGGRCRRPGRRSRERRCRSTRPSVLRRNSPTPSPPRIAPASCTGI